MGKLSLILGPLAAGGGVVAFLYWVINCIPISFFIEDENSDGWFDWTY